MRGSWCDVGPPAGDPCSATNSRLFVPLLHAAWGALSSQAAEAWSHDERCQPWWDEACHTLRHSAAVPATLLLDALREAAARHHVPPPQTILTAARALPSGAALHLSQLATPDGYIHAGAQEVCLQLYGGLSFGSNLDRYSDALRQADAAPVPPVPATTRPAVDDPGARPFDGDDGLNSQDDEVAAAVSERAPGAGCPTTARARWRASWPQSWTRKQDPRASGAGRRPIRCCGCRRCSDAS